MITWSETCKHLRLFQQPPVFYYGPHCNFPQLESRGLVLGSSCTFSVHKQNPLVANHQFYSIKWNWLFASLKQRSLNNIITNKNIVVHVPSFNSGLEWWIFKHEGVMNWSWPFGYNIGKPMECEKSILIAVYTFFSGWMNGFNWLKGR